MRKLVATKRRTLVLIAGIMLISMTLLVQAPTSDARSGPDCGPTFEWSCALPNCEECPEILFEGTVCEKQQFEAATGRICTQS
jgi:hypothetical protein